MIYLRFFWITFIFLIGFVFVRPFIWIVAQKKSWNHYYFFISKIWAKFFYFCLGIHIKIKWKFEPDKNKVYIFCPNHFSYLDIPLLTYAIPKYFSFVGLSELGKIFLFGYLYRKFHILVDRSSLKDKYRTYKDSISALQNGKSLVIFPEGGIWATDFPKMAAFKEGAFRMAIESKVEIVPVSLPDNWKMMPLFEWRKLRFCHQNIIFHQPIITENLTNNDIKNIAQLCFETIQKQL
ncbi:MAG: 1-acyl-sn-glycerol-3-phosphate acyltransferase [Cytophagia bacterium]|nr:MAG: 1-acyl-sn-glycerol-3-phosphate acyltransferase [Cytophagia bacterium]TAG39460.1 MAG: 1-acyl-sn-glycerol-3-phosphate acyltransferase [Cytophagia bacterium]